MAPCWHRLTDVKDSAVSKWDNNDMYIPGGPKKRPELLHGSVLGENSYRHIRRCLLITYMLFCWFISSTLLHNAMRKFGTFSFGPPGNIIAEAGIITSYCDYFPARKRCTGFIAASFFHHFTSCIPSVADTIILTWLVHRISEFQRLPCIRRLFPVLIRLVWCGLVGVSASFWIYTDQRSVAPPGFCNRGGKWGMGL